MTTAAVSGSSDSGGPEGPGAFSTATRLADPTGHPAPAGASGDGGNAPVAAVTSAHGRTFRRWRALAVLLVGQTMVVLDVSAVNVAIPGIRSGLHAAGSTLQLVVSGYTLAYAVLLVTGARLGDDYGHRRLFVGGLAAFVLTSFGCGVAPNSAVLVTTRVLQGVAAAAMVPQVLSIIQRHFSARDRVRALGLYAAVFASGLGLGQVIGGLLVGVDLAGLGWRPVFLINVPVGLVLIPIAVRTLPATPRAPGRPVDARGIVLLSASMSALVLPLILGHDQGWPVWTWVSLAGAVVGLAGFVAVSLRTTRRGGDTLLDLGVLADRTVSSGLAGIFTVMLCWGAFLFSFTLLLQGGLGYSPLRSGLSFLTAAPAFAVASLWWSKLPARLHRWIPTAGLLVSAPAYLGVGLVVRAGWSPLPGMIILGVLGLALGAAFSPLMGQTTAQVRPEHIAGASGLIPTSVQLATVVGVASLGTLYLSRVGSSASEALFEVTVAAAGLSLLAMAGAIRVARAPS